MAPNSRGHTTRRHQVDSGKKKAKGFEKIVGAGVVA
jgi:hypothetical protein